LGASGEKNIKDGTPRRAPEVALFEAPARRDEVQMPAETDTVADRRHWWLTLYAAARSCR
jgi:hypothetical protein